MIAFGIRAAKTALSYDVDHHNDARLRGIYNRTVYSTAADGISGSVSIERVAQRSYPARAARFAWTIARAVWPRKRERSS